MAAPAGVAPTDDVLDLERLCAMSTTELFSMSDVDIETMRLAGLRAHFAEMVEKIPVLRRLAQDQHIDRIDRLEDAAPLLFPHSVYKSYAMSALEKNRFDILTRWLQTLTVHDLSGIDLARCQDIDSWIDALDAIGLPMMHSSGTTGKLSFLPRDEREARLAAIAFQRMFEGFGDEPDADLEGFDDLPIVLIGHRKGGMGMARQVDFVVRYSRGGDERDVRASNPGRLSADALSIGGRIRAAETRGELGRLQLAPSLLARRDSFIKEQEAAPQRLRDFFADVSERLKGQRIILISLLSHLYDLAADGLAQNLSGIFSPDSASLIAGGNKGRSLPEDYREKILQFTGFEQFPPQNYGMTEMVAGGSRECPYGYYHIRPYIIPYQLDPKTGALLPRTGRQTGRLGFVDLLASSHWGGFLSGDEVTITWDQPCACGRTGAYIDPDVRRYAEMEGGDDKITCAGAPEAHDRALDFIAGAGA